MIMGMMIILTTMMMMTTLVLEVILNGSIREAGVEAEKHVPPYS